MGSSKYSKSVCLPCVAALLGQIYAEVECCLLLRMSGCVRWANGRRQPWERKVEWRSSDEGFPLPLISSVDDLITHHDPHV